jgi:hypothetical protein
MKRCPDESNADYDWSTMDRDLDMAVFEFDPGSVLTKDKQRHLVVGFTGDLLPPERRGRDIQLEDESYARIWWMRVEAAYPR